VLHVRVVSPPAATGDLVELLAADQGVRGLVVLPGAARHPDGDAIQFDLLDQSANPVLHALRTRIGDGDGDGDGEAGSIVVQSVDASISATGTQGRPHHADLPPVWDLVEAKIRAGGRYPPSFFALLVIAGLIGAVGILTNSQILIVGAMVVGPEYGAIMATALGIDKRDRGAIRLGLTALAVGFALAVLATFVFGLLIRWSGAAPKLYEEGVRPVSDLINSPNVFSVIVAVLAGVVGVVSLTEAQANALIGVFISVTTIPAAADMGLSAAYGSWSEARGSTFQLLLNVVLLIAVGAGGLRLQRAIWRTRTERAAPRTGRPASPA
jgi:uncharacterized hydrophobic protein (TIGR00271 family)